MNMKPCNFEQELLFSLHRMGTVWERMRMGWHCMFCPECRRRRAELAAASRALMTLRPSSLALSASVPGSRRTRLIMCSAAVAIAAAVLSYYLSVRMEPSLAPSFAQTGNNAAAGAGHCAPVAVDNGTASNAIKPTAREQKPKKTSSDNAVVSR